MFNRLHNKEQYVGTGIGLAICKKIIDNHKGYIFAEGIPNQGAIYYIFTCLRPQMRSFFNGNFIKCSQNHVRIKRVSLNNFVLFIFIKM